MTARFVAGYRLDHNDIVNFLKMENLVDADEEVDDFMAHIMFEQWALGLHSENPRGEYVPWPQCA